MPRLLAVALALTVSVNSPVLAQSWQIDSNHSNAQFSVRHMMVSNVRGDLGRVTGTVEFDGKDLSKISVDATIDATGINTRVERRDTHLKSPDFLEVEKYPTITFKSKRSEPSGAGRLKLIGDLTIRGVTKEVALDVEGPTPEIKERGGSRIGATATTKINRKDFGLQWNRPLEAGGWVVGDEVAVTIDLELTRKPQGPSTGAQAGKPLQNDM